MAISNRMFVEEWWRNRLLEGRQIDRDSLKQFPVEVRGAGPWYKTVGLVTLYADFLQFYRDRHAEIDNEISHTSFVMLFRNVLPPMRTVYARLTVGGEKVRRRCFKFDQREFYMRQNKELFLDRQDAA